MMMRLTNGEQVLISVRYDVPHAEPHTDESVSMSPVSYTDLRQNLASFMDEVCDSRAPLVITRQKGRSVVMISQEEFESMVETLHLLRSPANAAWLLESIAQADAGNVVERNIAVARDIE